MKNFLLFLVMVIISSCGTDLTESFKKEDLIGIWKLEEADFINSLGEELTEVFITSTTMKLSEDQSYYRNYFTGNWTMEDAKLKLDSNQWEYQIMEVGDDFIKMKLELTDIQYGWNFKEVADDEILTIIETYSRIE